MFAASSEAKDRNGNALITAYALHRPDTEWSLMLVNRDHDHSHQVHVVFEESAGRHGSFTGPVTFVTFGSEQYVWREGGRNSHPDPDGPPVSTDVPGGPNATFTLPNASVIVLRGHVGFVEAQPNSQESRFM